MNKKLIEKVKNFVISECNKPTSKVHKDVIRDHFMPMEKHAKKLCRLLGGDFEIITLAVWLHDIGSIKYRRKDHHLTSEKVAKELLEKENYDEKKLKVVLDCIRHHRRSTDFDRKTVEEKIIADADAIANFDMINGIFYYAYVVEKLSPIAAGKSAFEKLSDKWRKLHFKESKDLVRKKYQAAVLLLKEISEL